MRNFTILAATLMALLGVARFANATTYVASRAVGTGYVDLSITTNGHIGTLTNGDIVDWTITVTRGANTFTLLGPAGGGNSQYILAGDALSATATDLLFNFGGPGEFAYALFQSPILGSGGPFWCVQAKGCFDTNGPGEGIRDNGLSRQGYTGLQPIASAAGVPEPTTWSLLIAGFALAGAALRRRRGTAVA